MSCKYVLPNNSNYYIITPKKCKANKFSENIKLSNNQERTENGKADPIYIYASTMTQMFQLCFDFKVLFHSVITREIAKMAKNEAFEDTCNVGI